MTPDPDERRPDIEQAVEIEALAERVFDAWASPDGISGWFVDHARGDAREEDAVVWGWEAFDVEVRVQVLESDPPNRLVLRQETRGGPALTTEVDLVEDDGTTRLRLRQSGFETGTGDDALRDQRSGWALSLAQLKEYVERHEGEGKRVFQALVPVPEDVSPSEAADALREIDAWLGEGSALGDPGEPIELSLASGDELTGTLLVDTGQELLLRWEEIAGTLELKVFTDAPDQLLVGFRGHTWKLDAEEAEALGERLAPALEQLRAQL